MKNTLRWYKAGPIVWRMCWLELSFSSDVAETGLLLVAQLNYDPRPTSQHSIMVPEEPHHDLPCRVTQASNAASFLVLSPLSRSNDRPKRMCRGDVTLKVTAQSSKNEKPSNVIQCGCFGDTEGARGIIKTAAWTNGKQQAYFLKGIFQHCSSDSHSFTTISFLNSEIFLRPLMLYP